MFDGTLNMFGVDFRRLTNRFQMTGTINCNNHCTQTLFLRVGKNGLSSASVSNKKAVQLRGGLVRLRRIGCLELALVIFATGC